MTYVKAAVLIHVSCLYARKFGPPPFAISNMAHPLGALLQRQASELNPNLAGELEVHKNSDSKLWPLTWF